MNLAASYSPAIEFGWPTGTIIFIRSPTTNKMLDELNSETLLHLVDAKNKDATQTIMQMRRVFSQRARVHDNHRSVYQALYHLFGGLSVVLAVVVSGVDGCDNETTVVVLSLSVACLTTILNFFGIEGRIQRHDTTSKQYQGLCLELERFLLTNEEAVADDPEGARQLERKVFDRYAMVSAGEPSLSPCFKSQPEVPVPSAIELEIGPPRPMVRQRRLVGGVEEHLVRRDQ